MSKNVTPVIIYLQVGTSLETNYGCVDSYNSVRRLVKQTMRWNMITIAKQIIGKCICQTNQSWEQ